MIRSLVKRGIKRVLRMETRPAEYGGPTAYAPPPEPPMPPSEPPMPPAAVAPEAPSPEPEVVVAAPEPAKKAKKPRAKKAKVEEVVARPPAPAPSLSQASGSEQDDVAGPALD